MPCTNRQPCGRHQEIYLIGKPWQSNTIKYHNWWYQGGNSCLSVKLFPSLEKETKYPPQEEFSQPSTSPQRKILVAYRILNCRLAIETYPRDSKLCHFCSCNVVENKTHFVLECPLNNFIKDKFHSPFEKVVLRRLKSFFQMDHQVNVSIYLTQATTLHHSRELASLTSSWCIISPIRLLASKTFKPISFHYKKYQKQIKDEHGLTLLNDMGSHNITVGYWELSLNLSPLMQIFKPNVIFWGPT